MAPSGECLRGYKPGAADCSRLAPSCGSFLPVLNPVVIPGLHAGTCAVLRGNLLTVSKCVCHLCNKELLYFTFFYRALTAKCRRLVNSVVDGVKHLPPMGSNFDEFMDPARTD